MLAFWIVGAVLIGFLLAVLVAGLLQAAGKPTPPIKGREQ